MAEMMKSFQRHGELANRESYSKTTTSAGTTVFLFTSDFALVKFLIHAEFSIDNKILNKLHVTRKVYIQINITGCILLFQISIF